MAALVIAQINQRDPNKMAAYAEAAAKTLAPYGGEILHRGRFDATLLGKAHPHGLGVLRFPDTHSARRWFVSPEYQAVAPLRDEAAEMTFVLYDLAG